MSEDMPQVYDVTLDSFLGLIAPLMDVDVGKVRRIAVDTQRGLATKQSDRPLDISELEHRWYEALSKSSVDYSVYEEDAYIAEMWACWAVFSKTSLRSVIRAGLLRDADRIVDLGCGVGLTTAALAQSSGSTNVIGTNLPNTKQWTIASRIAEAYGFKLSADLPTGPTDVVLASEFFEHLTAPIAYLREVVVTLSPRMLIVANSFNTRAIGHFREYDVDGHVVDASKLGRIFNAEMRRLGYDQQKLGFWNSRPAVWLRRGETLSAKKKEQAMSEDTGAAVPYTTEVAPIADLKPHPRNYRKHPPDQLAHLAESIKRHGFYRNVVVARDGTILAGHGVVEAAQSIGRTEVPVFRLDVGPNDAVALKVMVGDNQIAQLGDVDDRSLTEMLKEISKTDFTGLLGTGFDEQMLANLVFVTRPESEINTMDEAAEWAASGMPEFVPGETPHSKIVLNFRNEADRVAFLTLAGYDPASNLRGVWFPPKPRNDNKAVEFTT